MIKALTQLLPVLCMPLYKCSFEKTASIILMVLLELFTWAEDWKNSGDQYVPFSPYCCHHGYSKGRIYLIYNAGTESSLFWLSDLTEPLLKADQRKEEKEAPQAHTSGQFPTLWTKYISKSWSEKPTLLGRMLDYKKQKHNLALRGKKLKKREVLFCFKTTGGFHI